MPLCLYCFCFDESILKKAIFVVVSSLYSDHGQHFSPDFDQNRLTSLKVSLKEIFEKVNFVKRQQMATKA